MDVGAGLVLAGFIAGLGLVLTANMLRWHREHAEARAWRTRMASTALPTPLADAPKVSIIVAAWNEADILTRHIESVLLLRYPNKEYILCAGGADGSYEIAARYEPQGVLLLRQEKGEGKQRALRHCFERSSGAIVYFTDADCLVDDVSFESVITPLIVEEEMVATGQSRPLTEQLDRSILVGYRWAGAVYNAAHQAPYVNGILGRNAAVMRSAVEQAGGLQEDVPTGTDFHLAKSLLAQGVRILHVPESIVHSRYAEQPLAYLRQQRRWLRNSVLLGLRFRSNEDVRASLTASAVGMVVIVLPLLGLVVPQLLMVWALVVLHGSLSKVRYFAFAATAGELPRQRAVAGSLWAVVLTLWESLVWASTLFDYLTPVGRRSW